MMPPPIFAPAHRTRTALRSALIVVYALAGWLHLRSPQAFVAIVPPWVPWPHAVVLMTGIAELLGAAALMIAPLRRAGGWGLAAYALCVWPANVHHAFAHVAIDGVVLGWWYHAPRLAFQPVLIWAALFAGNITCWPFKPGRITI